MLKTTVYMIPGSLSYQNKWPHRLMTASLAVSKQMLHSNVARSRCSRSPSPPPPPPPLPPGPPLLPLSRLAAPPSLEARGSAAAIAVAALSSTGEGRVGGGSVPLNHPEAFFIGPLLLLGYINLAPIGCYWPLWAGGGTVASDWPTRHRCRV